MTLYSSMMTQSTLHVYDTYTPFTVCLCSVATATSFADVWSTAVTR